MSPTTPTDQTRSQRLAFYASLIFFLLLFGFEEYYFNFPHLRFIATYRAGIAPGGILSLLLGLVGWYGTFLALWVAARSRPAWRLAYLFLFVIGSIAQYGYWRTLGRTLSTLDIFTGLSSSPELWLDAAKLYVNGWALLPTAGFVVLLFITSRSRTFGAGGFALVSAAVIAFFSLTYFLNIRLPLTAVSDALEVLVEAVWSDVETAGYERLPLAYRAPHPPDNNVILVIDESVRGDSLSLNGYHRPTTPYLESLAEAGTLHNWGIAVSAATCSLASNAAIVNGLTSLPDSEGRVFQNPTLFHYARAMGYRTWALDAQSSTIWNGLQDQDVLLIDERLTPFELGHDETVDFVAAERIREIVTTSTGNFILVNKLGVHFPYYKIYPPEAAVWTPEIENDRYEASPELINTYDNALRYNVDRFFQTLLADELALEDTTIVYTSDHGQTLGQVEGWWAHCGSSRVEVMVPLFIIGDLAGVDTDFPASHFNIFPTILDLMGYPVEHRPLAYPLSLLEATAADRADRYFLSTAEQFSEGTVVNFDADPPPLLGENKE